MFNRSCYALIRWSFAGVAVVAALAASAQTPGSVDTTFGSSGAVTLPISPGSGDDRNHGMVLQPDGKIVVGGTCGDDFCLARVLANGTIDGSFGSGGRIIQNIVGTDVAYAMTQQPDGKLVLAGTCVPSSSLVSSMCAARFTANGALDASFGGTGWVTVNVTSGGDVARAVAVQADGRIVLAGGCTGFGSATQQDFCLVRLNGDGTPDGGFGFGSGGQVLTTFGGTALAQGAQALAIQPDGKILAAGYCRVSSLDRFCIARYAAGDGQLDTTFGVGNTGYVITQLIASYHNRAYAIALQPNGKIVVGGECGSAPCLIRYLTTGSVDTSFGTSGVAGDGGNTTFEGKTGALALTHDGTILFAGWSNPIAGIDGRRIYRFGPDGQPLSGFFVTSPVSSFYVDGEAQGWNAVAIQRDGKVVVAATSAEASPALGDMLIVRYHGFPSELANCSLDIDGDGKVLATTDVLIQARVALGMTGNAVIAGITFAQHAQRQTWADIRIYLIGQCGMTIR